MLLLAAGFFFLFSNIRKAPLQIEEQQTQETLGIPGSVQSFVENCIRQTIEPSIYLLSIQGGVIYPDKDSQILLTDHGLINYAWLNGINGISREKMQNDLGRYLKENIDSCLKNFETFRTQKIIVTPDYSKVSAEIIILDSSIDAQLEFPLKVELPSGDVQSLDKFSVQIQSRLGRVVGIVESLKYPDLSPQDLTATTYQPAIFPFDPSVTIYSLSTDNLQEPLSFMFAVRDDYPANNAPNLDFIADKTFTVGDLWQEQLSAEDPDDDILTYSSDSSIFPISKEGIIDTEITSSGIFEVTFTVEDGRGGSGSQKIRILVLDNEQ